MMEELKGLPNELDEILVREHPAGLWLVLGEEYPQQQITADDLLDIDRLSGAGPPGRIAGEP